DKGAELQLEARKIPLVQVLNKIVDVTQVQIHYSVLPQGLVTATCVGSALQQIMACLLNQKADFILRYPQQGIAKNKPSEAWILGASFETTKIGTENAAVCAAKGPQVHSAKPVANELSVHKTRQLLTMAKASDAAQRASAISRLMTEAPIGDESVREVLENALTDQDPYVRSQAVSSYARREGAGATAILQEALQDSEASVRLMAVDNIVDNPELLQQALQDKDNSVRELAAMRLQALDRKNNQSQ
ncbi:MAG: HEAT repeat domain-containing protein, partial [Methylococcales bacterium]